LVDVRSKRVINIFNGDLPTHSSLTLVEPNRREPAAVGVTGTRYHFTAKKRGDF
jgi:hypothetical protein